ncbi:MAG: methyltransferase [Bacteroidales bacterium]|nr:methyltransferase [Bacteroidales bacterium]
MSNGYFRFQQFEIKQDKTAMKVSTDGILLGSLCDFSLSSNILDIGTGTGLIALMSAQRSKAKISAVEIDKDAFLQAQENVLNSKFALRIKVFNDDFLNFYNYCNEKFDYIVSNPPFFENSYKSNDYKRNFARHTDSLPFEKMILGVKKLLSEDGFFSVIIPNKCSLDFIKICALNGIHLTRKTKIFSKPNSVELRHVLTFSKQILPFNKNEIIIYNENGLYTECYKNLTKDFYFKF